MTARPLCRLCLLAAVACATVAAEAARAGEPPFEGDAAFQKRITVRVTGMPLDQLLPRVGAELGVSLRPAATDVGDLRVSVFAEDLPAGRVLTAITAMLNLAPEGGFQWYRERGMTRPAYRLERSQQARLAAAERLRAEEAALAARFPAQVRSMRTDPEMKQLWAMPGPLPRLQRGSELVASLSEEQLAQLQRDGVLALRQPEVSAGQQKIIGRLVADVVGSIDDFLRAHPEEAPRYQNIDPAATSVVLEMHAQAPHLSVVARLNLGPDKGGSRNGVWHLPDVPVPDPEPRTRSRPPAGEEPGAEARKVTLEPRSWTMAAVLSELARRSRAPLVADCYTVSWPELQGLPPLPLAALLDEIGRRCEMRWERRDGVLLLRSRRPSARQAVEVPQRLIDRWEAQIERDRAVGLGTLDEMCRLSDTQLFLLRDQWEMGRLVPDLNFLAWSAKYPIRIYSLLSDEQRAQVARGGVRIPYRELTPVQRRQLAFWAAVSRPEVPEAEYERAVVQMLLADGNRWQVTLSLDSRGDPATWWLGVGRNWNTGAPLPAPPAPKAEELTGRLAPPLSVKTLDGKPVTLPAGKGQPFVVLFREVWVVPYIGPLSDAADLDGLAALVERRPELREWAAVICPGERAAVVREWASGQRKGLPIYVDETGSLVQAFGWGPLPRLVSISPEGRVEAVRSGYSAILPAGGMGPSGRVGSGKEPGRIGECRAGAASAVRPGMSHLELSRTAGGSD